LKHLVAVFLILCVLGCTACSTPRGRFLVGAGIGGGVAGGTALVLSPNHESTLLNGLVFGLAGALLGGLAGLWAGDNPGAETPKGSLREREQSSGAIYSVPESGALPAFVKDRLQPVVIEEIQEGDSISEDGSLHEPHKIYRIQRPAELFVRPKLQGEAAHGSGVVRSVGGAP